MLSGNDLTISSAFDLFAMTWNLSASDQSDHVATPFLFIWNKYLRIDDGFKGADASKFFKGALDMYNIFLFVSNSIDNFELNQYQNFQLI